MEFKVLGPLEVISRERAQTPSAPKIRQLLALLVLRLNQVVSLDTVMEELWGTEPPRSAVTTAQTYIYQLRKIFVRELGSAGSNMIETTAPGYLLRVNESQVDFRDFDRLIEQARLLLGAGQQERAARQLQSALGRWNGPALSNVSCGRILQGYVTHLEEKRITALEILVQAEMDLGNHRDLIAELRTLVMAHPFNEWFHIQLITALGRSGRRGDALNAYQDARHILGEELGLDPSAELELVHQDVLRVGSSVTSITSRQTLAPTRRAG
jgi:DNA-binding SARP family transcriptional activator